MNHVSDVHVRDSFSISDHNAIHFNLNFNIVCKKIEYYYDWHRVNYNNIQNEFLKLNIQNLILNSPSATNKWMIFNQFIENTCISNVPLKFKKYKGKYKYDKLVNRLSKKKLKLFNKYKQTSDPVINIAYKKAKYELRNRINILAQSEQNAVFNSNNPKQFYKFINKFLKGNENAIDVIKVKNQEIITNLK